MPRFDLNLLGALDALLTERNVTRAAERLHVTQPTMSGMLQRLRYQFSDPLLVRNGRHMALTHLAESLVAPVREALGRVQALAGAVRDFDPAHSTRSFTIMASDYCSLIFLPRVIARLRQVAPGVRLDIRALNAPVERLFSGELDVCIAADKLSLLGWQPSDGDLYSAHLFTDEFVCVVSDAHPISAAPTLNEYLKYPRIAVQFLGIGHTIDADSLLRQAPECSPTCLVPDFSLVACMVVGTDLIGIVQKRLAEIASRTHPIRTFAPPFAIPALNEALLWSERQACDPGQSWLRSLILEEADAWLRGRQPSTDGAAIPLRQLRAIG